MKEITHLVVNGCSWTYCQGLENPTQDGWPALLAKKLGVKVVNLAVRGCGNDSIHRRTHEYVYENLPFNSKPFFVIAWSQYWRREAWQKEFLGRADYDDYAPVSFPRDTPQNNLERALLDNWSHIDFYRKTYLYKLSLMNLFKAYDIEYFMSDYAFPEEQDSPDIKKIYDRFPNLVNTCLNNTNQIIPFHKITKNFTKLPCGHDDVKAQSFLAEYIYTEFSKHYQTPKVIKGEFLTLNNFKLSENPSTRDNQTVWR
jgi:hypothetical protein